ncbi:phytanoyl-CoA dioxygenase family protein [Pseudonocardia lacus]|uniref:phytanoyl-CoA dioxygenase family protein n=1 Tax=Pseudonocardia lacus TaxID=2835865 RepID=UPI001BDC906A|nr:phytanoyl-CoA dioxygenase family protein [Pseudonocardia lacus]
MRTTVTSPAWLDPADCRVEDLRAVVEERTDPAEFPRADVVQGVTVYETAALLGETARREVQAELVRALLDGPGIVVLRGAFPDTAVVDRATAAFTALIDAQRAVGTAAGDHFAAAGSNDRVWNALEKLAVADPDAFTAYYANEALALVCDAWLGPGYQVTSQINVVNPGGAAQSPHRDYHLGFQGPAGAARYAAHVHRLTPALTLQGAVAHVDMPLETGPTLYLPHSQKYAGGYLVSDRDDFRAHFAEHHVQLPLAKGDAVFFNPAVLHGAGTNRTADVRRMANLLQVSSAFGRAMEAVDRARVSRAVLPALRRARAAGVGERALRNVVAAAAEGYAFPTDLDHNQPVDGLAPPTQADLLTRAVLDGWDDDRFAAALG